MSVATKGASVIRPSRLMDLEHVRPSVEPRLVLGTSLGLSRVMPRSCSEGAVGLLEGVVAGS